MSEKRSVTDIARGLDPIDWVQVRRLARMSPAERVLDGMRRAEEERTVVREELRRLYPHLADWQINMKVLAHFTLIRMPKSDPRHPDSY